MNIEFQGKECHGYLNALKLSETLDLIVRYADISEIPMDVKDIVNVSSILLSGIATPVVHFNTPDSRVPLDGYIDLSRLLNFKDNKFPILWENMEMVFYEDLNKETQQRFMDTIVPCVEIFGDNSQCNDFKKYLRGNCKEWRETIIDNLMEQVDVLQADKISITQ